MVLGYSFPDSPKTSLYFLHASEGSYDSLACFLCQDADCKYQLFVLLLFAHDVGLESLENLHLQDVNVF